MVGLQLISSGSSLRSVVRAGVGTDWSGWRSGWRGDRSSDLRGDGIFSWRKDFLEFFEKNATFCIYAIVASKKDIVCEK